MLNTLHLATMRGNDASVSSSPIRCRPRLRSPDLGHSVQVCELVMPCRTYSGRVEQHRQGASAVRCVVRCVLRCMVRGAWGMQAHDRAPGRLVQGGEG